MYKYTETCTDEYHYVHIAINKSRIKEFRVQSDPYSDDRKVYLDDNSEFQIELFNPTDKTIGAKISINGDDIGDSLLVLYPGQRIWLERDFISKNKFKFIVYDVEANNTIVDRVIKHNGEIKVEFYKEKENFYPYNFPNNRLIEYTPDFYTYRAGDFIPTNIYNTTCSIEPYSSTANSATTCATYDVSVSTINTACSSVSATCDMRETKETGIVGKSENKSKQKFANVDGIDFNFYPYKSENIHIFPMSEKMIVSTDIKRYCSNCGRKLKQSFKFCPICGTKVE